MADALRPRPVSIQFHVDFAIRVSISRRTERVCSRRGHPCSLPYGQAAQRKKTTQVPSVEMDQSPLISHTEHHFTAGEIVRDIIIGMSDGLTVPFALAAGLSGASASSTIIVTAGLAEVAAGAIAMGLGGYLAAKSDADHYNRERRREQEEIIAVPDLEADEVRDILSKFGLKPDEYNPVVRALMSRPDDWLEFMMRFELGLEKPDPQRALASAGTIAISYVLGGLIPLVPYMVLKKAETALMVSVAVTLVALLLFGFFKGYFTGTRPFISAVQTACIGAIASAAAFGIALLIGANS